MSDVSGYWSRTMALRHGRRRVLGGSLGLGLGAAALALAGCGGGDDEGGGGASLLGKAEDTTKVAKAGATYRDVTNADPSGFDPYPASGAAQDVGRRVYGRLLGFAPGVLGTPPSGLTEPDLAEAFEMTPDHLQVTFKLRPDAKWDARTPTSSRPVDAQDVTFSWDRFARLHYGRVELANSASPLAPVTSVTAPDSRTIVFKLAFPMSAFLEVLCNVYRFNIMPREAEGGFDPRRDARGSAAWMLSDYAASSSLTYTKNPNWYRKDRPFIDRWEVPIVPEYATRLAQFRAGNIFATTLRNEDILPAKKDLPELVMLPGEFGDSFTQVRFGFRPGSPFRDERVRQAVSMLIDRETYIKVFSAVDEYAKEGLTPETRWYTQTAVKTEGGWLNPQGKEFGVNAKYYKLDLPEAKKLLAAAGHGQGFTTDANYSSTSTASFPNYDAVVGMLAEGGIKLNVKVLDQTLEFSRRISPSGKGDFDGIGMTGGNAAPSVPEFLWRRYHSGGSAFAGYDPDGLDRNRGDPQIDAMTNKMRQEFDPKRRLELIHEFQRYFAQKQYEVAYGGEHHGYSLTWPAVRNAGVYRAGSFGGAPVEANIHLWVDPTKRPLGQG